MKLRCVTGPSIYCFITDNMTTLLVKVEEANPKGEIGDSREIVCEKKCIQLTMFYSKSGFYQHRKQ